MAIGYWVLAKCSKYDDANDDNGDKSDDFGIENCFDAGIDKCFNHVWPLHKSCKESEKQYRVHNV